jgi:hypothetical protein
MIGLACLAAAAGRVHAEGEGGFLNTDIGASFITGMPSSVTVDPGLRFSLVPGYRIYNDDLFSVSLQFDTGLIWNQYHGGGTRGDLYQVPFLGGFEYAFHTGSIVEPYLGVEGGGVYSNFTADGPVGAQNAVNGAVQGMAGIRFKLSDSAEIGVGYKFLATFPSNVDYLGTHSASVTFIVRF